MEKAERVTVTLLFSDIEGSTRLLEQLGERWPATLEAHRAVVRAALETCGGTEHGTEGDSFFASFPSAAGAVGAAALILRGLAATAWPEGAELRVRLGIHTGEAQRSGDGWVGIEVHRAARIAAAAHGGQVVLSQATTQLVRQVLPPGTTLRDLGAHQLKDLPEPERLHQLVVDGLREEFPPLRGVQDTPHNLPGQLTTFVGRDAQVEEAGALLASAPLLTLVGPGGTGKTRLALRLAGKVLRDYPDGVWFVPLAPVRDPDLVASSVLASLGLGDRGAEAPDVRLREYVRDRRMLLVLDNFEQVVDAAPLVGDLLRDAPALRVVVTSRSALHVSGEQEYEVPPLSVPPPEDVAVEALMAYESVALFLQRAAAVTPDFRLTPANAAAVAEICARLEGLPLAIELAAARVKLLPPPALLARLSRGLDVLESQARDLTPRQRTLRGAIAWSDDLLHAPTRRLFARLSVFRAGCALEQADEVCGVEGADVLAALDELVDHSLLRQLERNGEPRFLLLEVVREYAAEQLTAAGEDESIRDRHGQAFLTLAEDGAGELMGPQGAWWLDRLEGELDNFRAALDWMAERDPSCALRLGTALWRVWQMRGHLHEGRARLEALVPRAAEADPALRARGFEALGGLAYWQADIPAARASYERMLEIEQELGDRERVAEALYNLAFTYQMGAYDLGTRDIERTMALLEEALALYRELRADVGTAKCLWALSTNAYDRAMTHLEQGDAEAAHDGFVQSLDYGTESLAVFRRYGDWFGTGWALHAVGMTLIRLDRPDDARTALVEGLELFVEHRDMSGVVLLLDDLAAVGMHAGRIDDALRIRGGAERLRHDTGTDLARLVNSQEGRFEAADLDERERELWREGAALPTEELIVLARSL